jgi:hypothetical protein
VPDQRQPDAAAIALITARSPRLTIPAEERMRSTSKEPGVPSQRTPHCPYKLVLRRNALTFPSENCLARREAFVTSPARIVFICGFPPRDREPTDSILLNCRTLISKPTLILPAPVCAGKPGMLLYATPNTTASLALQQIRTQQKNAQSVAGDSDCFTGYFSQIRCVPSAEPASPHSMPRHRLPHR